MKTFPLTVAILAAAMLAAPALAGALKPSQFADSKTIVIDTQDSFDSLRSRLEAGVKDNGFFVVTRASASAGAASRGVSIPGNLVVGVYRNDYAVRMLEASVAAGVEAPLRFYVTESADGTATLSYRLPSRVFAPYGSPDLDAMARELDEIWREIAKAATLH